MINVSNEFRKLMNVRTDFKENAEVSLANGETLTLTEKDFTISNNSVTDAGEVSGIPLGVAIGRTVQIELMNDDDRFSEYDFFGAKIRLFLKFQLSSTVERIEYGTFTVITPETYGTTVLITAVDNMHKADTEYITELVYPASLRTIVIDACEKIGVVLDSTTFNNDNFVVSEKPTGLTIRQLLGYIAMIAGGNVRFDTTGLLKIITYDFEKMADDYNAVVNGGKFKPWDNPSNLDGGTFSPWNVGDVVDGGTFSDREDYHILMNWKDLKIDTDDVVITGIKNIYQDADNNEQTAFYGVEGYLLSIENPLIAGKEQEAVELIGSVMVGGRFRQFSGDLVANPLCEFMDPALIVDRRGNVYSSFLTDINFQFFGFTTLSNSAKTALRNSSVHYSEATQTLIESRKLINKERTAREAAVEQLANNLKNSSGLFMTEEVQPDGSIIYYMHDKPTLEESMVVWKLTSLAFAISNDGGKTYPYGFTVDGTTITRLLYAEGINADYINAGSIQISENGKTIFLADYDESILSIDADYVFIGSSNIKRYVDAVSENLQSQIDGVVDTWNGEAVPTLNNYPANEWTTDDAKKSHVGDIYYVVGDSEQSGQAYRFQYLNGVFSWELLKDSDITKALQDAAEALNKANEVGENLELNYSTTSEVKSLIKSESDSIKLGVKETYATQLSVNALSQYATDIRDDLYYEYSKTTEIQSMIALESDDIKLSVSETYETIVNSNKKYGSLSSRIDLEADKIEVEVNRATSEEQKLSSRISETAEQINLKVSKGDIISEINQTAETIRISAQKIDLEGLVEAEEFVSKYASLELLHTTVANINYLLAQKATIEQLDALQIEVNELYADKISTNELQSEISSLGYATADTINAAIADLGIVKANYVTADEISADSINSIIGDITQVNVRNLLCYQKMFTTDLSVSGTFKFKDMTVVLKTIGSNIHLVAVEDV